ncbi:MAG: putative NAD/FAD-binding protein [Bradymonadia bacterium]|jgi:predicted NAD/FAD-binding protein
MRIAIIGSGIAGLSACWALGLDNEIVVYEAAASLGMDAHSLDVPTPDGPVRVDVPLRVFHEGYYPTLGAIYREAGVESAPVDSSASFSTSDGELLFRYGNKKLGPAYVPWLTRVGMYKPSVVRTGIEAGHMVLRLRRERDRPDVISGVTFGDYLRSAPFSAEFVDNFLLPAVAGIATCTYDAVRAFPARTVLAYLDSPRTHTMRRAKHGARDVVNRLSSRAAEIRCGDPVQSVVRKEGSVEVASRSGLESFDHVVFATQATRVGHILESTEVERRVLAGFRYEHSELVVHTDTRLAPPKRAWWSPVNYVLFPGAAAPMTTVVLSDIHPGKWKGEHVFQTWNPLIEPEESCVLKHVKVERALVDSETAEAVAGLNALHMDPDRRVWFCGSYANEAMTLQESAAVSATQLAKRIRG